MILPQWLDTRRYVSTCKSFQFVTSFKPLIIWNEAENSCNSRHVHNGQKSLKKLNFVVKVINNFIGILKSEKHFQSCYKKFKFPSNSISILWRQIHLFVRPWYCPEWLRVFFQFFKKYGHDFSTKIHSFSKEEELILLHRLDGIWKMWINHATKLQQQTYSALRLVINLLPACKVSRLEKSP